MLCNLGVSVPPFAGLVAQNLTRAAPSACSRERQTPLIPEEPVKTRKDTPAQRLMTSFHFQASDLAFWWR